MVVSLSRDGLALAVSTDYSGKIQLELYRRRDTNSQWTFTNELDNLNKIEDLVFPSFQNDSTLFFSVVTSEYKDMDIYSTTFSSEVEEWQTPVLMSKFNSIADDFGLVFWDEKSGYFTSNRSGEDKLYRFTIQD